EQLASSYSVLTDDEKELGACIVDIGGGTTDISIFWEDRIHFTSVVPLGGEHLTSDIAFGLRTPIDKAEHIKNNYGSLQIHQIKPDETIEVPGVGGRPSKTVSRNFLVDIIRPRAIEILEYIRKEIEKSDMFDLMKVGAVFTGGTALLPGMPELAEEILDMPVKIAQPSGINGGLVEAVNSPIYSTAVGLILFALNNDIEEANSYLRNETSIIDKIKKWLKEFM
ncbi:MAG: cell division protein FtsA, partial [Calditrichia bacterium]|nr:cell division protein FtsA [Calditrichia bacterium]